MEKLKFWKNIKSTQNFFKAKSIDFRLIYVTFALLVFGLVIVSSATKSYETLAFVEKQGFATLIGVVAMFALMLIDYRVWRKYYLILYIISILLLLATLLFGHGDTTWGAKSWLQIGPVNFQPSEFVKVWLIICLATWLENHKESLNQVKILAQTLIFAGFPVFLIMLQPDLGTSMVYIVFIAVMLFFSDLDWKYILSAFAASLISLPILYMKLDGYQKDRILDFLNPEDNLSSTGYQAYEGRIAIGNGRLLGRGLYKGTQTQFNFIPTKETDSIFPVLVEELGFLGGSLLILLYLVLLLRLIKISTFSKDEAGKLMVLGFISLFLVHIWENIGMTLGLMPFTGIPLPFISYGGSFQIINLAMIGLALSVRYHRFKKTPVNAKSFENWFVEKYHSIGDYYDRKLKREYNKRKRK